MEESREELPEGVDGHGEALLASLAGADVREVGISIPGGGTIPVNLELDRQVISRGYYESVKEPGKFVFVQSEDGETVTYYYYDTKPMERKPMKLGLGYFKQLYKRKF